MGKSIHKNLTSEFVKFLRDCSTELTVSLASKNTAQPSDLQQWLETMVSLQRSHNEKVHPDWDKQGYPFTRAVWVECAELIEHYGWKWWKHQEPDIEQVKLELVDIWHFGLSELMIEYGEEVVDRLVTELIYAMAHVEESEFRDAVEELAAQALAGRFSVHAFTSAMLVLPMSFADLFSIYVGKNVLNVFRQEHGYKEGTYRKVWNGREDNEHLTEISKALNVQCETYMKDLKALLTERYEQSQPKDS